MHSATPTTRPFTAADAADDRVTIHAGVAAVRRLTASVLEVTLTGCAAFRLTGGDEFVFVMVSPAPGGISREYTMDDFLRRHPADPVRGAYYTVRRSRRDAGEIDLWVVDHGNPGSVGRWFAEAAPGAALALWGPRRGFSIPDDAEHVLLAADASGLAAVAAIVETMAAGCRATAVLSVGGAEHRPELPAHPGLRIVWAERTEGATNRVLDEVVALRPERAFDAAFGAAEVRQTSAVRRHVRHALRIPAARVLMTGYWRREDET